MEPNPENDLNDEPQDELDDDFWDEVEAGMQVDDAELYEAVDALDLIQDYLDGQIEIDDLMDDVEIADDAPEIEEDIGLAEQPRGDRTWARAFAVSVIVGAAVTAVAVVCIVKYLKLKDNSTGEMSPGSLDSAKKIVDTFRRRPEMDHWSTIAKFVDLKKPGYQMQAMTMIYTKLLSEEGAKVDWEPAIKRDYVHALIAARDASGRDSDIYRTVLTIKHGNEHLSRAMRADLCLQAVAKLRARSRVSFDVSDNA